MRVTAGPHRTINNNNKQTRYKHMANTGYSVQFVCADLHIVVVCVPIHMPRITIQGWSDTIHFIYAMHM